MAKPVKSFKNTCKGLNSFTFPSVIFMYEILPKPERKIERKKVAKTLNFLLFVSRKISP